MQLKANGRGYYCIQVLLLKGPLKIRVSGTWERGDLYILSFPSLGLFQSGFWKMHTQESHTCINKQREREMNE